ncbi:helix-turn-helix domain-containing protein [Alicyclobacillus fastidiosus]|nr:helix-turn-helix domain-containing protein [Alicyclobacillus fastidiosus]WEH12170.1 helix-turn-helix domain-containing protein [Alicyclobacillus fastidiosus]
MHDKGMSVSQIAREVGRDRKTVRKWLGESAPGIYKRGTYKPKIIDP